jgi:hypothetical protein
VGLENGWAKSVKPGPVIQETGKAYRMMKHTEKSKERAPDQLIFWITGFYIYIKEALKEIRKKLQKNFLLKCTRTNFSDSRSHDIDLTRNPHIFLINSNYNNYYPLLALTIFSFKSEPAI